MANRAYVSAWAKDFSEATQLEQFTRFLETVPAVGDGSPGFNMLVVHAIDPAESPVREWDLRSSAMKPTDVADLLREHSGADLAFEIHASWDLSSFNVEANKIQLMPQPLEIICQGPEYDDGASADQGDFLIDTGFEHLFVGHGDLLARNPNVIPIRPATDDDLVEPPLLRLTSNPDGLREYIQRTRQNIQLLFSWLRTAESNVPLDRYRMWSEGEDNFEARVDDILAVR